MKSSRKKTAPVKKEADVLPLADLSHLYTGLDSAEINNDRAGIEERVQDFHALYAGKISSLSGRELARAIKDYEEIESRRALISSYVALLEMDGKGAYAQTEPIKNWNGQVETVLSFFRAEIGEMKELDLMPKLSDPALARHASWIAGVRSLYGYGTEPDVAEYYQDHARASRTAWMRLYHETLGDMRFLHEGKEEPLDSFEARAYDQDPVKCKAARDEIARVLKSQGKRMAQILNVLIKDKQVADDKRGFARDDAETNLLNRLDDRIVDAMVNAVVQSYPRISHRYFEMEARAEEMARGISVTDSFNKAAEDDRIAWPGAKGFVLRAFNRFSSRFSRIAKKFFDEDYIDAEPRAGKFSGAFTLSSGRYGHPYIFMHYNGEIADVVTLAHELGHGIHDRLAERKHGALGTEIPTVVAETASIFAEMIVFNELLRREKDPEERNGILQYRLENMIESVHREVSYYDFEKKVHAARKEGELTVEEISDIWLSTRKDYLGPAAKLDDFERYSWMTVTHFFDTPFYVYSYAAAQLIVIALHEESLKNPESKAFAKKYTEMLEAGSTKNMDELMHDFGFDLKDPSFWKKSLKLMEGWVASLDGKVVPEAAHPDLCRDDTHAPPSSSSRKKRSSPSKKPGL